MSRAMWAAWHRLQADYGSTYLGVLAAMYLGVKGYSAGVLRSVALPFFQQIHRVTLADYHRMYIVAMVVPWCMKPLAGVFSDLVPIFNYRKKFYVGACGMIAAACTMLIADNSWSSRQAMAMFSIVSSCIMMSDLLFEASYSEQLRSPGIKLSANLIVTFVFTLMLIGMTIGAVIVGTQADQNRITEVIWSAAPPFLLLTLLAAAGTIPEAKSWIAWETINARKHLVVMCLVLSGAAATAAATLFYVHPSTQLAIILAESVVVIAMSFATLPTTLASCNTFLFLADALRVDLTGATAYFYTDNCVGTPNFTYTFYTSWSTLLGSVFGLIGIALFQRIQHNTLRQIFAGLTIVQCAAASLELAQATRLNVRWGINDELMYIMGEAMLSPVIQMMYYLPMFVLTSQLVERGSEALTYAILAGTQNFGSMVSTVMGNYFIWHYNIADCNFTNLPVGILIGKMVLPILIVPMTYLCLPDIRLSHKH
jgi:hypothetical protein